MERGMSVAEQKLAEKLLILNSRGQGMITRIYNIKKACSDPKSRPQFLADRSLEQAVKQIVKKFPSMENSKAPHMQPVFQICGDIVKGLSNYYYTFVDVMMFRDHTMELLTSIDAHFVHFDISLNFDLTKAYFDLIATYACLFLIVSRVEDRKAVLGLFNHAYDMSKGHIEPSFPRLGQMIVDFEIPVKKLYEEFIPHALRVGIALQSLNTLFMKRNLAGDQMRQAQLLSLTSTPQQMLNPAQTETVSCEYLSLEEMKRWLIFCYMLCPSQLTAQPGALEVWKTVLQDGFSIRIYRDEVLLVHKEIQAHFEGIKGFSKRVKEVQDFQVVAITNSAIFHRERRRYLRMAMEELCFILSDQPGLLGPKVLIALLALSHARDEIQWLVRHNFHPLPKSKKINPDDFQDRQLPELLYRVVELRELFNKYSQVIRRYFIQYLSGFDVAVLKEVIQKISVCPEDESMIMTSFIETLSSVHVKQVECHETIDFRGLRLDWMRLQAYTSVRGSVPELKDTRDLASLMNIVVLHSKLVDAQLELINDVSDLSELCFYPGIFEKRFLSCLEDPYQMRFSIAFPLVCTHFLNCTNDVCPEEKHPIGDRALSAVNSFLDAMAFKASNFISHLCDEQLRLNRQLASWRSVAFLPDEGEKSKRDKSRMQIVKPGEESKARNMEELTNLEETQQGQLDLLLSLTQHKDIKVWEHVFTPREYLVSHLEDYFAKTVFKLMNYNETTQEIARPSELLRDIKSYMSSLHRLEEVVNIDMGRIFNTTLLQQTQNCDSSGGPTLTSCYTSWYVDVFLKRVTSAGGICFSPLRKCFVSRNKTYPKAEDYTDVTEMRALCELLGAYGVKFFCRKMMGQVFGQVEELKKLVLINKDILVALKDSFNKPEQNFELIKRLKNFEDVLARTIIIGVVLCFRTLLMEGLQDVLPKRVPYLMHVLRDFKEHNQRGNTTITYEMSEAAGISSEFDAELYNALKNNREKSEEEGPIWSLLLVYWAASIPTLAYKDSSEYNPALEAHENNAHCMSKAINALSQTLFTITGDNVEERLKDFLAIATANLLKLGMELGTKEVVPKQRESVYILIDVIVRDSPYLGMDELDQCFPYGLIRDAYHFVYKKMRVHIPTSGKGAAGSEQETA